VVTVDVDPSDTPTRIKYALQYNDPMKEMMGGGAGEARIVIDGSGGNRDPVLGNMVIVDYRVLPDSEGPAKQFADEMAERLKAASK
jgi:hypothetical protein